VTRWRVTIGLLLAPMLVWSACRDEPRPTLYITPARSRITALLEPPTLGIGQVAQLEVTVVTPPEHLPQNYQPPDEVPGFWILASETLAPEIDANRRIHRTRFRIRARETGSFHWPGGSVEVEVPDAESEVLILEPLPLEVTSVFPNYPDRVAPFGLPEPLKREPASGRLFWAGAAVGVSSTMASLGLVWLARRRRRTVDAAPPPIAPADPPWEAALHALQAARLEIDEHPFNACQAIAGTLRRYMAQRYGADVNPRTTEELERAMPPFAATSRWPGFVAILRRLDALRFEPDGGDSASARSRSLEVWLESERFVRETIPHESLR
jgi:hypothetical protein